MNEMSLMPSGLESNLTISDVRDLLTFLETSAEGGGATFILCLTNLKQASWPYAPILNHLFTQEG